MAAAEVRVLLAALAAALVTATALMPQGLLDKVVRALAAAAPPNLAVVVVAVQAAQALRAAQAQFHLPLVALVLLLASQELLSHAQAVVAADIKTKAAQFQQAARGAVETEQQAQ